MVETNVRIDDHPILGPVGLGPEVTFSFNGKPVVGVAGEPIAVALWAAGIKAVRTDLRSGEPRGMYCGVGHCYECRVTVNGVPNVRSCLEPVRPGLVVSGEESAQP